MKSVLLGREVLAREVGTNGQSVLEDEGVEVESGWCQVKGKWVCRRCRQSSGLVETSYCTCGKNCGYCRNCLQMGKIKKCSRLYHLPDAVSLPGGPVKLGWKGTLSPQQAVASHEVVEAVQTKTDRLLWAVTGAGKTEMLFQGIQASLSAGERVGIASPRVDVCLELAPRLQAAFPEVELITLHGQAKESYLYTPLVISTVHQLLRFKEAFDLLVIDEVDAFPYDHEPMLPAATEKSRKKRSALIYLTATPDQDVRRQFTPDEIVTLPARYHGHPLPEPHFKWSHHWQTNLLGGIKRQPVLKKIAQKLKDGRPFLIFLPRIDWMLRFEKVLRRLFPQAEFAAVHAADPKRREKVMAMRAGDVQFLLTTTILERGVTFKGIDVFVIGAEDRVFTESALVQIAGRAGRSPEQPTGEVVFYHDGLTRAMKRARRQIRSMNRQALERGLLHHE